MFTFVHVCAFAQCLSNPPILLFALASSCLAPFALCPCFAVNTRVQPMKLRYAASLVDPAHVLFLTYEDMIQDPAAAIAKVAAFTGCGNDPAVIAQVAHTVDI